MRWCSAKKDQQIEADEMEFAGATHLGVTCCLKCDEKCFDVIKSGNVSRWDDVSVVTTLTFHRISALEKLREVWEGYIVALVYISDYEGKQSADLQVEKVEKLVSGWENSTILVYRTNKEAEVNTIEKGNSFVEKSGTIIPLLPINSMRNAVMNFVNTRFVFPLDVDFLPSKYAYKKISELIPWMKTQNKLAVVLPHWETSSCARGKRLDKLESSYPLNFDTMLRYVKLGLMRPFHADMNHFHFDDQIVNHQKLRGCENQLKSSNIKGNPWGVRLSSYENWINASISQGSDLIPIELGKDADLMHWEPYFVVDKRNSEGNLIRYNELFVARILNKVEWVAALRVQGFKFFSLSRHFLIHKSHRPSSFAKKLEFHFPSHRNKMEAIFEIHLNEVRNQSKPQMILQNFSMKHVSSMNQSESSNPFYFQVYHIFIITICVYLLYFFKRFILKLKSRQIAKRTN
jgi:hypothetical protein